MFDLARNRASLMSRFSRRRWPPQYCFRLVHVATRNSLLLPKPPREPSHRQMTPAKAFSKQPDRAIKIRFWLSLVPGPRTLSTPGMPPRTKLHSTDLCRPTRL